MRFTSVTAVTAAAVTTLAFAATTSVPAQAAPTPTHAAATKISVRVATFNVRTARADLGTKRQWLHRATAVAKTIKSRNPGIVTLQELGPGRADGKKTKLNGAIRQTDSLVKALDKIGPNKYELVRVTAYVAPGTPHDTQGTRILYDKKRYKLLSNCPETTAKSNYNGSCSMEMPLLPNDSKGDTRSAAYAKFQDRASGKSFWVVSVHLDTRHGKAESSYDSLRADQVRSVYERVSGLAKGQPIIFDGDFNSWKTKDGSDAPFNYLTGKGFVDAATAPKRVDAAYPTVNHFDTTMKKNAPGRQVALDHVMASAPARFTSYENVMKVKDSSRASDHNMVVANLVLGG